MAKIFHTSHLGAIRPGHRIGAGGEGEVFEVQERADLVAKLYLEPPSAEKADKLIALARLGTERLLNLSAWPVDVLRREPGGPVVGFVMKKIEQAEEVHTLHSPKSRLQKFPEASWAFLLYAAANIARAVAAMHEHGFVIGDLNPKNILVTRKATVYLLDCDSFQVTAEGKTWRCEAGFPEYTPPELQGAAFREFDRRQEHDYFGLAVVIFQLLFLGRHPYSGRFAGEYEMPLERAIQEGRFAYGHDAASRQMQPPPGSLQLEAASAPIVAMFRRAFLSAGRPQPREWVEPLESLAKSLRKCALHSGHFYFQQLAECPWCHIESRARIRLFNFMLAGADGTRAPFRLDEVWKEIEAISPPDIALVSTETLPDRLSLSDEAAALARRRTKRFIQALMFSAVAGLGVAWLADFPYSFMLLFWVAVGAQWIARIDSPRSNPVQTLFQTPQPAPDDPLVDRIQGRKWQAEDQVRQIEERLGKEAGAERFLAKLDELQARKDAYANLAQLRERKLKQLEADAIRRQRDEFLGRFEINEADISGVWFKANTVLPAHGIETAADVTEQKLRQVPKIGQYHSTKLLEWRRDLERQFEFDPARGIPPRARIAAEKEIDELRHRLEHELGGGAFYLRRAKQEIEARQRKLQPALLGAVRALAQAEKDWEAAIKRYSLTPILLVLLFAFLAGMVLQSAMEVEEYSGPTTRHPESGVVIEDSPPSVPISANAPKLTREIYDEARDLYLRGVEHSNKGEYSDAAELFRQAVAIDPGAWQAHEDLGVACYYLGAFDRSIAASLEAIRLNANANNTVVSHYYLGLSYVAQHRWEEAKAALRIALSLSNEAQWDARDSDAYYNLACVLTQLGEAELRIEQLTNGFAAGVEGNAERFELANLYLWVGKHGAAKKQHGILKQNSPKLAEEFRRLLVRHGVV